MVNISLIIQSHPFLFISEFLLATAPTRTPLYSAIQPFSRISPSLNLFSAPDTITMSGKKAVAYFVNWVGLSGESFTN